VVAAHEHAPSTSVQHRVLGDLNLVHGLLGLARRRIDDAHAASMLESSRDRVRAIALAYSHGWRVTEGATDGRADPAPVLRALVDEIKHVSTSGCAVAITVDVRDVRLSFDQLVPIVLLCRELVANAFAHAFEGKTRGQVSLALVPAQGDRATLTVTDDGAGLPADLAARRVKTLGLALVSMLAEQIQAEVTTSPASASGCRWALSFPLE
jgi:two-component sensor histidine kinase